MANLEELLKKVSEIVVREKTQQEEKRKRGENFNIFRVLGLSTSEVRLHSAFLAELLNPNGDHGLGSKPLEAFVNDIVSNEIKFPFDYESAKVYVELDIGPISEDETEGGRIDIFIQDMNKQTIIIENKIYAGDQPKQMLRYYNYVTKNEHLDYEKNQFRLLYLTLDEHAPSQESTGNNNVVESSIKCINYKENILTWLERCIEISALYPAIREIISQYATNIKQILNIMSETNKSELINLLKKNISSAVSVLSMEDEIRKEVRRNYINTVIKRLANNRGYEISKNFEDFVNNRNESIITFEKKDAPNKYGNFVLRIYAPSSNNISVYFGIMFKDENDKGKKAEKSIWNISDNMFPFGCCYLRNPYWNRNNIIIKMQSEIDMYTDIYPEDSIAKEIENQLIFIEEKALINELEGICTKE